jgi:hypothetical protein
MSGLQFESMLVPWSAPEHHENNKLVFTHAYCVRMYVCMEEIHSIYYIVILLEEINSILTLTGIAVGFLVGATLGERLGSLVET